MLIRIYLIAFLLAFFNNIYAQEVVLVKDGAGATKEILLLPFYPFTDALTKGLDIVGTDYIMKESSDFKGQLNKAAEETMKAGGNVFQITGINNTKQKGLYKVKGTAFRVDQYDLVKSKALELKNQSLENGKQAILTVYRPVYVSGFNDDIAFDVIINDTLKLEMWANTKYIIKVSKDCSAKISVNNGSIIQHINVQLGKKYHVRALANFPGSGNHIKVGEMNLRLRGYDPYFEVMDDEQGELESSLVNKITIISKKIE